MTVQPLSPDRLCRRTDPASFDFETTADLEPLADHLGQDRALAAARFGVGIKKPGFNLFALGPTGLRKHGFVRRLLEAAARGEPVPDDWCYVHDFQEPQKPRALRLPAGRGAPFERDVRQLVDELQVAIPAAFEGDDFRTRLEAINAEMEERTEAAFHELQEQAKARDMAVLRTPMGFAIAPVRDGEVLSPDEFRALPEEEQERRKEGLGELEERLQQTLRTVPQIEKEHRAKVRELHREVMGYTVEHAMAEVRTRYADLDEVVEWLDAAQKDMVEHAAELLARPSQAEARGPAGAPAAGLAGADAGDRFKRYRVNLLVDRTGAEGAPVVYESLPSHGNLLGRIEHLATFGALVTDFTLVRAGALHRANGGYLILDARKLLMQPFAWEELKRTLKSGEIRIESLGRSLSLVATVSLEPEPVPLSLKVVLIGEPWLYYALARIDPEFPELFKVAVDFERDLDRSDDHVQAYARLVADLAREDGLRPFDAAAVARVQDRAARLAEHADKLACVTENVADLLREADHEAGEAGAEVVTAQHVQQAIDAWTWRSDRLRSRVQEAIRRGLVAIDTDGAVVGQVNGLSVLELGGFAFGRPSRITARYRLGRGEVVDIEREVELGGPIHSKGVLILSGFLGARYARERPLSLQASLVFEQSYGGIEGDSASSAELYALLSSLADVPLRQGLAVTGSVDQHGRVQAIGGVNEKIEGFFDVCRDAGLTGEQGVLIPAANVQHLMLRHDVVEAVAAGRFRVWAVATVDQGLELLTGLEAGEADDDGVYPEGTVNRRVQDRLEALTEAVRRYSKSDDGGNGS